MKSNPKESDAYAPLEEGDYYLNAEGLMVFTAQYLLKRGHCCHNQCTHCPYPKSESTDE